MLLLFFISSGRSSAGANETWGLYCWGSNSYGQLGTDNTDTFSYFNIRTLKNHKK
jgi:alpha-tubulin suppressor-like RCC1 family protein